MLVPTWIALESMAKQVLQQEGGPSTYNGAQNSLLQPTQGLERFSHRGLRLVLRQELSGVVRAPVPVTEEFALGCFPAAAPRRPRQSWLWGSR